MMINKEEIIKRVISELEECLQSCYGEDSIEEVVEVNKEEKTITIKFSYSIVEEDNYIGLASY